MKYTYNFLIWIGLKKLAWKHVALYPEIPDIKIIKTNIRQKKGQPGDRVKCPLDIQL